jgi:cytochrome c biogenesis protein CcmG/thiol:disulfide interchange protein DsbE
VLVLAAIAVFAVVSADDGGSPASESPPAETSTAGVAQRGSPAPDFDLARLRSPGRVRLADLRGRPVIVNFWAAWCVPCRKEFPTFREAQARYREDGLAIVGITFKDLPDDARRFAKQQRANWLLAEGGDGDPVGKAYGVRALPQTFFVNRRGIIVARYFGAPSGDDFDAAVQKIL